MSDKDLGSPSSQRGQTPQFPLNLGSTAPANTSTECRVPEPRRPSVATPSSQPLTVASGPAFPSGSRDGAPALAFLGRGHGHSSPASPSAGSASKINPEAPERGAGRAESGAGTSGTPRGAQAGFGCGQSPSAGAAGSAESAAAGPPFRWETNAEERGKKQHWQRGDCPGEFAEPLSPNTRAASPPGSPFPGTGNGWGRAGTAPGVPQFPPGGTHVHLVHVHDGGRGTESAQAVADPVLQGHPPELAVVGGSPAAW